jgi:hypothetical protein
VVPNSGAIAKYLNLFANPFTADSVGLPVFPSPPSTKITSWYRGTLYTGTSGIGFVYGQPVAANDVTNWVHSSASTTGVVLTSTGGTNFTPSGLPYAGSQMTEASGIRQRCVCVAIRIRYIGRDQDLGGVFYPFIHPNHGSTAAFTQAQINAFEEAYVSIPVSRQWTTLVWAPIHRTELEFCHLPTQPSHNDIEAAGPQHLFIMVSATAGLPFEFEVVQHHEFLGTGTGMTRTDNQVTMSAEPMLSKLTDPKVNVRTPFTSNLRGTLAGLGGAVARLAVQEATNTIRARTGFLRSDL